MLDTNQSLKELVTPAGQAATFGVSGQLSEPFGGHRGYCLIVAIGYGLLGALIAILEVAYEFDHFARSGSLLAVLGGGWLFGTVYFAMWCDWRLTSLGCSHGLKLSLAIVVLGALLCGLAAAALVLPGRSIALLTDTALPARNAYFGGLFYHLLLLFAFCLPTFHFVLVMKREMLGGRHASVFGLLTRDRSIAPPRGVFFPPISFLLLVVVVFLFWRGIAYFTLAAKLRPGRYYQLFSVVAQTRLICFFALIFMAVYWYFKTLNELKRECLLAARLEKAAIH